MLAEQKLYDNTSLTAQKAHETASQVARTLIVRLGHGEPFNGYVPASLNDDQKKQVEAEVKKRVEKAALQASEILNKYSKEGLENLCKVYKDHQDLRPYETEWLLQGKSYKEVRPDFFQRTFKRILPLPNPAEETQPAPTEGTNGTGDAADAAQAENPAEADSSTAPGPGNPAANSTNPAAGSTDPADAPANEAPAGTQTGENPPADPPPPAHPSEN